ncbi:CHAT domain-containing protein [Suillus paluster]|uniref:CHAT domain-containing protein n=1 Tax=Suillus paluster TaxID=48578 RepID=UPI001B86641A|nr:CHAT domain-containing protein [Suillus paluster]KAG1722327.1 CHAT domain-containing protein [Suillus paluster]
MEIRASFECGGMLGHGELIGKLERSWNELLNNGDEPFDLSFPLIRGVHPSLTLKAASVHARGNDDGGLLDCVVDCQIVRDTDTGHSKFAEYMISKVVSHLNDAVERFQSVLDQCPAGHPDHAAAATNLDREDIDATTSLFRDALALCPQGHPDRPLSLYHLTNALIWHYNNQHTTNDICECAKLHYELLSLCPDGTYLRSITVGGNGDYVILACNNLAPDGSDEGIQLRRLVLELCPLGHQHHLSAFNKLSWALRERFTQYGNIDDLDEIIQCFREVVSTLAPKGCHHHGTYLNNLALSIAWHFDHQGKSHDLDEAISLYEEVLCLFPIGHASRDAPLDNLGGALHTCFIQCGDINDINRAISLYHEALTLCPPGHPTCDSTLNNLAIALATRYDKFNPSEDLNEAVNLHHQSLRLRQLDNPQRHRNLVNFSSALCSRFMETRNNRDIKEAINLCQQSLAVLPSLHPDRYFSYVWLKDAYLARYQVQHNPADLSLALENSRLASLHPTQGLPQCIIAACNWIVAAEQHNNDGSALEAYALFFELLDAHLATRSSTTSQREATAALNYASTLPVDAATCALRHHNLQKAVELVEQGRCHQWSLASRLRTPLEDLEFTNPNLAHKFSALSKRLSDAQGAIGSADRATADRAVVEYRRLTKEWDTVVAEIRNHQDFSRFLLPPSYTELQIAASHGPVIILNASKYLCDALVIPTSGQPYHVPFPSLALAHLEVLKDDFTKAIRQTSGMRQEVPRTALMALLRRIWDVVMLPIIQVLQHVLKLLHHSRIWLYPTAVFTSIPLHADLYICSYTPTLSALIRSRQMMKNHTTPSFVVIRQSRGAGQGEELLAVENELELVRKLVPATADPTTLFGDAATRAGALEALQSNTWVHLACHGKQDHEEPYYSHFAMRDTCLTLLDINNAHKLNSCDEKMPDEVIHLAAGLQFSGFKSVVGTLWAVDDAVAKHVVEAFYQDIFKDLKEGDIDCTKGGVST